MQPQEPQPTTAQQPPQPTAVQTPPNPVPAQPTIPTENTKNKPPKWVLIIIVAFIAFFVFIAGFIGVIFFVVSSATKEPQKISDQLINYIQSGDSNAVYELTNENFKETTDKDQLDQIVEVLSPLVQGDETITDRFVEKSTDSVPKAVLVYKIDTTEGARYIRVQLQESNDSWQVANFRASEQELDAIVE